MHALRHACATPLLAAGTALPTRQQLVGHASGTTTLRSVPVTQKRVAAQGSPLANLLGDDKLVA